MLNTEQEKWGRKYNTPLLKGICNIGCGFGLVFFLFVWFSNMRREQISIMPLGLLILITFLWIYSMWQLFHADYQYIRYIEVKPGQIKIVRRKTTLVLDNISSITPFTRDGDGKNVFYYNRRRKKRYGLNKYDSQQHSSVIGPFTLICNNFDELALVVLDNGFKYVINYPRELLTEKN